MPPSQGEIHKVLQNLHTISVVQIDIIEKMEIYFRLCSLNVFIAPRVISLTPQTLTSLRFAI